MSNVSRRGFLRATGVGAGLASLGAGAGTLLWPRGRAAADDRVFTTGAIIFMLNGGARTQALFNGSVGMPTNPFGTATPAQLGDVPLSALMANTGLVTNSTINNYLNLVATCEHHNRTGNHQEGRVVAATGYSESEVKPGILSILNQAFPFRPVPCVSIGFGNPTTLLGSEISAAMAPIVIPNPQDAGVLKDGVTGWTISDAENSRLDTLRFALEDAYHRNTAWASPEAIPVFQKQAKKIAQQLAAAPINPTADLAVRFGDFLGRYDGDGVYTDDDPDMGVTNQRLRTICNPNNNNPMGTQAMLAVRLRQLGCAGITISSPDNYDLHNNENTGLAPRATRIGQALSGLIRALSDIADPYITGATLLDTTIITFVTDFNRGNWGSNGFNGGGGTDHQSNNDRTSTQCIPIVAGKFGDKKGGMKILGSVDSGSGAPSSSSPEYQTRQVLATVLEFVGVPPELYFPGIKTLTAELSSPP